MKTGNLGPDNIDSITNIQLNGGYHHYQTKTLFYNTRPLVFKSTSGFNTFSMIKKPSLYVKHIATNSLMRFLKIKYFFSLLCKNNLAYHNANVVVVCKMRNRLIRSGWCYDHIFLRFLPIGVFLKTNVMIQILQKLDSILNKQCKSFCQFYGENIFKIITSVPGYLKNGPQVMMLATTASNDFDSILVPGT
jgi:hypothetical protein